MKLRKKQRKYAQNKAEGYSGAESVRLAGYKPGNSRNAAVMAHALNKKPEVQEYIGELMQKYDLNDDRLMAKHSALLDAEDKDGNPQFEVQRRVLEAAYKLKQYPGFGREIQVHAHQHNHVLQEAYEDLENGVIDQ